ncbi:hypothetical protein BHE74_00042953 [Ensete ventricosum]|nr:hypothetical protein BHE74_00042953 [Ensete ventricosum]
MVLPPRGQYHHHLGGTTAPPIVLPSGILQKIKRICQDGSDDAYGLDASAAHIANLLPSEPDAGTVFDVAYITFDSSSSSRSLKIKVESSRDAARRAASSPLPLCHGRGTAGRALGDGVVPYKQGERSEGVLRMSGFRKLTFKAYNGYASVAAATSSSQLVHISLS